MHHGCYEFVLKVSGVAQQHLSIIDQVLHIKISNDTISLSLLTNHFLTKTGRDRCKQNLQSSQS